METATLFAFWLLLCARAASSFPSVPMRRRFEDANIDHNSTGEVMGMLQVDQFYPRRDLDLDLHLLLAHDLARLFQDDQRQAIRAANHSSNLAVRHRNVNLNASNYPRQPPYFMQPVSSTPRGGYKVDITLGTNSGATHSTMGVIVDTASSVTWVQCQPCIECVPQDYPIYDPLKSDTFAKVPCPSIYCEKLPKTAIKSCVSRACTYGLGYGDGSKTYGMLGMETIAIGGWVQGMVLMGCSFKSDAKGLSGAAGILGLGRGEASIPTQYGSSFGGVFAYCLPMHFSTSKGYLKLGGARPAVTTPMVKNPLKDNFYYVDMEKIEVDDDFLNLDGNAFAIDLSTGWGGLVVDSGAAITRFPPAIYVQLRDAVRATMSKAGYQFYSASERLETCYHLPSSDLGDVDGLPLVSFHFGGDAVLVLEDMHVFLPHRITTDFCLAFAPTQPNSSFSVIGNAQLQGMEWSFNLATQEIGFIPGKCKY